MLYFGKGITMKKHLFKILSSITLVIAVTFFVFFNFTEPEKEVGELSYSETTASSYETTKTIVLPYLEPLTETEMLAFTEPEQEVEKLSYSELVIENPAIADIKTY